MNWPLQAAKSRFLGETRLRNDSLGHGVRPACGWRDEDGALKGGRYGQPIRSADEILESLPILFHLNSINLRLR
jgi:hypothetical protein